MIHVIVETFLVMFVGAVLVLALHYRMLAKQALYRPVVRDDLVTPPTVTAPSPAPVPPPPAPTRPSEELVRVTFLSEKGHTLGTTQIAKRWRRPTMQFRSRDGKLGTFTASHDGGGAFVYRRTGVERES